jgi:hypothetical protein
MPRYDNVVQVHLLVVQIYDNVDVEFGNPEDMLLQTHNQLN